MCYKKSNIIEYYLQPNIYGRGQAILNLDDGLIFINKLNKEYQNIHHILQYDSTNKLYFIEWKSRKINNNISIKI